MNKNLTTNDLVLVDEEKSYWPAELEFDSEPEIGDEFCDDCHAFHDPEYACAAFFDNAEKQAWAFYLATRTGHLERNS